jgi:hypothetical protein
VKLSPREQGPLVILVGSRTRRKILHITVLRRGLWEPVCATHHRATHDQHDRLARPAVEAELEYPVCKRCTFQAGLTDRSGQPLS